MNKEEYFQNTDHCVCIKLFFTINLCPKFLIFTNYNNGNMYLLSEGITEIKTDIYRQNIKTS